MGVDESFWTRLKEIYLDSGKNWDAEEDSLRDLMPLIEEHLETTTYRIRVPLKVGGAGIILKCEDLNLGTARALKFPRPVAAREEIIIQAVEKEIGRLLEVSHSNVMPIYYQGSVRCRDTAWPFYIMEYIEGAKDGLQYVKENAPDNEELILVVQQWINGIAHLHGRGILQIDVKLENFLVTPDGRAIVSDLGSAHPISGEDGITTLIVTPPFAHPELVTMLPGELSSPDRAPVKCPRADLKVQYDLYPLGKNLLRLVKMFDPADTKSLPPYTRAYFELMGTRLLDGYNRDIDERANGLPRKAYQEIKYNSIQQVVLDMKKLTGEYRIHKQVPELDQHFKDTIQLASPGATSMTKRLGALLAQPLFSRLGKISQLGLIIQVYPTASHSRLEHTLGTFANACLYCRALWNDAINPFFRQVMSEDDVKSLLAAALCHDLGQYPLAHDFEEADREVFSHTGVTVRLLRRELGGHLAEDVCHVLEAPDGWGVDLEKVVGILKADPNNTEEKLRMRLLHTLIDGPIDADKIDYLQRDAMNLGVPYGGAVDVARLLRCLTVAIADMGGEAFISLGTYEKAKYAAESVGFARYAMFGSVYWHHACRSAKAMFHRALWDAMRWSDKRAREYQEFRQEFEEYILGAGMAKSRQLGLFAEEKQSELPVPVQLVQADYAMLAWVYERTSAEGKRLLDMLVKRNLFKRLIVISSAKKRSLWQSLQRLRDKLREKGDFRSWVAFQGSVQEKLVSKLIEKAREEIDGHEQASSVLSVDNVTRMEMRHKVGQTLVLIDIPPNRSAEESDLYFLREHRIRGVPHLGRAAQAIETSGLWESVVSNFQESVGKVRVFVDPDFVDLFDAVLKEEDIEGILDACVLKAKE